MKQKIECIFSHFRKINVTEEALNAWWLHGGIRNEKTINKILENLPTKEQYLQWLALSEIKNINTLRKIRYPVICGWKFIDIMEAMKPYIYKIMKSLRSQRCEMEDCYNNAAIGIIKALRTDAGIQPFAAHAFLHIKTNVRRPMVTAGVVKTPERRPSKTDVRRVISKWLIDHLPINQTEMASYHIQKTGINNATEIFVKDSYLLSNLPISNRFELLNHLESIFKHENNCDITDSDRYKTINDLIEKISEPPSFNDTYKPMSDVEISGSEILINKKSPNPLEEVISNERKLRLKKLSDAVLLKLKLSKSQETILNHTYGINGTPKLTGSQIAEQYGCLTGNPDQPTISRQRVTQHQKTISKKMIEVAFETLYNDNKNNLEIAAKTANLTDIEKFVVCHFYGLFGMDRKDIAKIANKLKSTTNKYNHIDTELMVNEVINDTKPKLIQASI